MRFDPAEAAQGPLLLRSTHPLLPSIVKARFNVTVDPRDWTMADRSIASARAAMINRLGEHGYWMNHLDCTNTETVLVNSNARTGLAELANEMGMQQFWKWLNSKSGGNASRLLSKYARYFPRAEGGITPEGIGPEATSHWNDCCWPQASLRDDEKTLDGTEEGWTH